MLKTLFALGMLASASVSISVAAAPVPGTSTSVLISEKPELYRSAHGFQLDAANTSWYLQESKANSAHLETIYKSPKLSQGLQASLTVRVDQRKANESFKLYLKRALKDYARLGMEVLKTRPVKINQFTGFLVDALGQKKQKQIRQLVFGKGKTMVILTCRDGKNNFQDSVKDCNEIFKTFKWL